MKKNKIFNYETKNNNDKLWNKSLLESTFNVILKLEGIKDLTQVIVKYKKQGAK